MIHVQEIEQLGDRLCETLTLLIQNEKIFCQNMCEQLRLIRLEAEEMHSNIQYISGGFYE